MMDLTQVQKEILTALISIQRQKGRAIKAEEIASMIDRNPGTIRNQMQSLKALHLVDGVPGPKGGYRTTAAAYEALSLDSPDVVVDVPVVRNGSVVEGATVNEITFYTVMRPDQCNGLIHIIGNLKEFNADDIIEVGPTPVNKTYIKGLIAGRDDTSNRVIVDIKEMISPPKVPIRDMGQPVEITLSPETSVQEASRTLVDADLDAAFVGYDGEVKGLINLKAISKAAAEGKMELPVKAFMIEDGPTIESDRPAYEAINAFNKSGHPEILITESGLPWGVLTPRDVIRYLSCF